MSELLSAIDAFRAESLPELPDALVEEEFDELHRAAEQIELERLRRLAEIDRRRLFERDGHISAASWLASTRRVSWGAARSSAALARALDEMRLTRQAIASGDVSISAARVLAQARECDPEAFATSESLLVEAARVHRVSDLHRVVAFWRETVDHDRGVDPGHRLRQRRRLHASVSFAGMVRVDGDLDPETGETLLTALRAVMDAEARRGGDDDRTPAQRRADALGEICRGWLDTGDRPTVAGERPHVNLTVGMSELDPGAVPSGRLDHVGPVHEGVARRLMCDASVMRVVMAGPSQPIDVGRRTKVVPPPLRRAVIVRDRTCRFPGCDRPHTWCDAHHVRHWADGGPTSLDNLLLLCRPHHRLIHRPRGFSLEVIGGRPLFRRPDGSVLEDRAPP